MEFKVARGDITRLQVDAMADAPEMVQRGCAILALRRKLRECRGQGLRMDSSLARDRERFPPSAEHS
jgi:O-acetyl-ADP-ribose deacetylase (regulator of RNase III)